MAEMFFILIKLIFDKENLTIQKQIDKIISESGKF